jgi:hypothetical protein
MIPAASGRHADPAFEMMEWRDQVAVVTGGARGLGRATAWLLAQRGAGRNSPYQISPG